MTAQARAGRPAPAARAIVLGASNVELYRRALAGLLARALPAPLELHLVCGLGRSYGLPSRVLGRELASIQAAGLWRALEGAPRVPSFAFVADVGNDLAYGAAPERVAAWVEEALERLRALDCRTAVIGLPLEALRAMGPLRFTLLRSLYFPGRPLRRAALVAAAEELEARLERCARSRALAYVPARGSWFGLDAIHLRPLRAEAALRAWLEGLALEPRGERPTAAQRRSVGRARPARSRRLGRERLVPQPCAALREHGTLSWW